MENLLFLGLLAVVGLLRWLSQMAEEKRNREAEKRAQGGAPNQPIPRAPATSEEERIRKFMEALGVPTTNAPPPPRIPSGQAAPPVASAPPATPTKRPVMPIDPFPQPRPLFPRSAPPTPAPPAPPPLMPPPPAAVPTETTTTPPPLPTRETSVFAEPKREQRPRRSKVAAAESPEVDPYGIDEDLYSAAAESPTGQEKSIAARLLTAEGAREAIILREIFGPPRSMQPLDLTQAN